MRKIMIFTHVLACLVLFSILPSFSQAAIPKEECDVVAGNPLDPEADGIGVKLQDLDSARAVKICRQALDHEPDSAKLQYQLGRAYYKGEQFDAAQEWILKSAHQGYVISQYAIGHLYLTGKGVKKNATTGIEWIQKAADQGFSEAQNWLGILYGAGKGVEKDFTQALHWYKKAAEAGNANAQFNLGAMYITGTGVSKDSAKASYWYKKAAEQEFDEVHFPLISDDDNRDKEAIRKYQETALQGYWHTLFELGFQYRFAFDAELDKIKAIKMFTIAANLGYPKAQAVVGHMYYKGEGIERDYQKAFRWREKAAHQGFTNAQFDLGRMYYKGEGVEKNKQLAIMWIQKAADKKHTKASVLLSMLSAELNEGEIDYGVYKNEQLGWVFPLPEGWSVIAKNKMAWLEEIAKDSIKKSAKPSSGTQQFVPLLNLQKYSSLFFSFTYTYDQKTEGLYKEHQKTIFQGTVEAYHLQKKGVDQNISREQIGSLWFDALAVTVYSSPEKKITNFHQVHYARLFDERVLTIILTYKNERGKTNILEALRKSEFTNSTEDH